MSQDRGYKAACREQVVFELKVFAGSITVAILCGFWFAS